MYKYVCIVFTHNLTTIQIFIIATIIKLHLDEYINYLINYNHCTKLLLLIIYLTFDKYNVYAHGINIIYLNYLELATCLYE